MMDISVPGGVPGKEAATAAKSGRQAGKGESAGNKDGFFDALTKAGGDPASIEVEIAGEAEIDREGIAASADKQPQHDRSAAKPLIDLSAASLKEQVEVQSESIADAGRIPAKPVKDRGKATTDLAFGKLDPKDQPTNADTHIEKSGKHPKAGKLEAEAGEDAETDIADDDVSDVLGLLNKEPGETGVAVPLQAPAVTHHATAKAGEAAPSGRKIEPVATKRDDDASDAMAIVGSHGEDGRLPAPENVEAEGKTFRISRADGRGQSMEMHIGTDQNAKPETSKTAAIETVSVLEARRYIGLAQNSNSAAVTAALSGDSEWARAMQPSSTLSNAAEWTSTGKVVNTLKIQMNPVDLGLVTATMRLSGDALNVDLKVETGAAYRQLKEDHGKILEALRSQGYAIDNVTISMAPVDRSDTGNQSNSQGQASQQQSLAQQGQGGEARERHNQAAQRTDGGFNDAGGTGMEDASVGVADGDRPSGVYL